MSYISACQSKNRNEVIVWERKDAVRTEQHYPTPHYFYVRDKNGSFKDIYGNKLKKITSKTYFEHKNSLDSYKHKGESTYESDINVEYKVLSKHYYESDTPNTHITFFDIEVDYDKERGFSDISNPYAPINAISIHHYWSNEDYVLVVPPKNRTGVTVEELNIHKEYPDVHLEIFKNEKELLIRFFDLIEDSDIISGWNSAYFDVPYIYERTKMVLSEAKANELSFYGAFPPKYKEVVDKHNIVKQKLELFGRQSVDYLEIFKKFEVVERHSFSLESVSEEMFPEMKKLEYPGSLYDLYRNDFEYFIRYNIRDCEILKAMEDELGYMKTAIQYSHSSSGLVIDIVGTIKLAELTIIDFCHNILDARVPDSVYDSTNSGEKFAGSLVLPPQVGMHDWVASVDVASLYPSSIRMCNISPETIIGQFYDTYNAFDKIHEQTDDMLFFKYENGDTEEKSAKEWRQYLLDNEYCISGYGSVFTQKIKGFIPTILSEWFAQRKKYKKQMFEAKNKMNQILEKYK